MGFHPFCFFEAGGSLAGVAKHSALINVIRTSLWGGEDSERKK
jgi:hypothetical protein